MTDNGLAASEWCRGCPDPIYDERRGEWDWYCRQWSPTGIRCSNVAVLLAGRWPAEVQAAIAAGRFAWVSGRVIGEFWKCIAACGLSREVTVGVV